MNPYIWWDLTLEDFLICTSPCYIVLCLPLCVSIGRIARRFSGCSYGYSVICHDIDREWCQIPRNVISQEYGQGGICWSRLRTCSIIDCSKLTHWDGAGYCYFCYYLWPLIFFEVVCGLEWTKEILMIGTFPGENYFNQGIHILYSWIIGDFSAEQFVFRWEAGIWSSWEIVILPIYLWSQMLLIHVCCVYFWTFTL